MSFTRICTEKILPHEKDLHAAIKDDKKVSAAFFKNKLWNQNATISVSFMDDPNDNISRPTPKELEMAGRNIDPLQYILQTSNVKDAIKRIVKERIEPIVNLTFKFVEDKNKTADVRISFSNPGSWSLLGTDCLHKKDGSATMNFEWFDVGTVIHEFGHVLGLIHEHQNPKGNIKWNVPKVIKYYENSQGWDKDQVETNIINRYDTSQINGSEFDPQSVMLYFFPADLTLDNKGSKQNYSLSGYDVEFINKTYPNQVDIRKWYRNIYDKSLDKSIHMSETEDKAISSPFSLTKILLAVLILLLVLILIYLTIRAERSE